MLSLFALLALVQTWAYGQTVWDGGTGNWSAAANWSTGVVPNSSTVNVWIDGRNSAFSRVTLDLPSADLYNLAIDPGDVLLTHGVLNTFGEVYLEGGLYNYSTFNSNYFLLILTSGTLCNYGTFNSEYDIDNNPIYNTGTINNHGVFNSGSSIDNQGLLNNYGLINNTGILSNDQWAQLDNSVVFYNNNGLIDNSGSLSNDYNARFYNSGTIYARGTLNNAGKLYSSGSLYNEATLTNGGTLDNSGEMTNSGAFVIAPGATMVNGDPTAASSQATFVQFAGSTVVDGVFSSSTTIQIDGGTLAGSGLIEGDVSMGGTLSPGDSPGRLTIHGNYSQLDSGTFFAELAGLTPGTEYDQLVVSGMATLDGTLDVVLLNGFVLQLGDHFVLMRFAHETGQFNLLDLPQLSAGESWMLLYNATDLTLSVVPSPEPSTFLLLGSGLLGMAALLRRKLVG